MASSPPGSSSQQRPTFLHTNGKKTTMVDPHGDNLPSTSGVNTIPSKKSQSIFDADIDAPSRPYTSTPASEYLAEPSLTRSAARYTDLAALNSSHPPNPDFKYREKGLSHEISSSTLSTLANDAISYPVTLKWPLQRKTLAEQSTHLPQYKEVEYVKPVSSRVNEGKGAAPTGTVQSYLHRTRLSSNHRGQSSSSNSNSNSQRQDNQRKPSPRLNGGGGPRPGSNQSNVPAKGTASGTANGSSNRPASRLTNGTAHRATSGQKNNNGHTSAPMQKKREKAQGKKDRIWPWKKGTCRKIATDTWRKIKAFFGVHAMPLSGMAKESNAGLGEVRPVMSPRRPPPSRRRAPRSSANPTSRPQPRSRLATRNGRNGNQGCSRRQHASSRLHNRIFAPKDPYDNGFLSAPGGTPCCASNRGTSSSANTNTNVNGKRPSRKTLQNARKWVSGLL
ncbi:hypothetical protein F4814DRAFT_448169 [Daldinia grandis]|nr:hypothetical protein F4814DRAFT_448169 [Daldinia grandis]